MMGRRSGQMAMVFVDMETMIPENHLLRKIDRIVSFDFIYEILAPYYPATNRPWDFDRREFPLPITG
jgi:transposase